MADLRTYAKLAGILMLLSLLGGGFGEAYVPSRIIVSGDAAATAKNLMTSASLFRLGFAGYLVEAICDVSLSLVFYLLLRPVRKDLSLLAAFFGLVSTALFGFAEMFYFAASLVVSGADYLNAFTPDQRNSLALLFLKVYGSGAGIFAAFYGITCILRGILIWRSGYLPKFLGALLAIAGLGFVTQNFALLLAPAWATGAFMLPMFLAAVSLTAWFLVKEPRVVTASALPTP